MSLRGTIRNIIFKTDTPLARGFDIVLIVCILLSVVAVMLDTISVLHARFERAFYIVEWFFTLMFTLEYALRLWSTNQRRRYAFSFFGIVDLLAIIPTYLSLMFAGAQYLIVLRIIRVLRVFRIMKFYQYMSESTQLMQALVASRRKIFVFLFAVLNVVVVIGSLMYLVEGPENGFTSIPKSIYWAIVTLTTVGYGDISPKTPFGQVLAAMIMILGYGVIAVPTGIVTVELSRKASLYQSHKCPGCGLGGHDDDAKFCKECGQGLGR